MAQYPYWIEQLAAFLTKAQGDYDFDHWSKDVRFSSSHGSRFAPAAR